MHKNPIWKLTCLSSFVARYKIVQQVKTSTTKPSNLSLITKSHTVVAWSPCVCPTPTNIYNVIKISHMHKIKEEKQNFYCYDPHGNIRVQKKINIDFKKIVKSPISSGYLIGLCLELSQCQRWGPWYWLHLRLNSNRQRTFFPWTYEKVGLS